MKLQCLKSFNEQGLYFVAGAVVDVSQPIGDYLLSSFPAYFTSYVEPVTAAVDDPPADKMVKRSRTVRK